MQQDYTYAVARIRSHETRLLSDSDLSALLSAKDASAVIRLLKDKGWGAGGDESTDRLLGCEEEKLWALINEIVPDRTVFAFLLVQNDFHNLKAAIKAITRGADAQPYFIHNALTDPCELLDALKRRDYPALPEYLRETAREAMTVLLQTSDGQLCDVIIDKACMDVVLRLGRDNENELIRMYCELFVVCADIKTAVRCAKMRKSRDFILRTLSECDTLDITRLAAAAATGYQEIIAYLETTEYRSAVPALERSMSAFEKWCDDYLTEMMKPQKWEPFSIGPVVAYIIARQNEIKAVRMILSAKINGLSEDMIKERLRMMYV